MNETIGIIFIVIGIIFNIAGCIGLIRLPDLYTQIQASTKCVTTGACGIMFGVFCYTGFTPTGIKALLVIAFILLTAPVSAHAIGRAARIFGAALCGKTVCNAYEEREDKIK
jgi:multicomponent Na+:H+ antiporter subunit G